MDKSHRLVLWFEEVDRHDTPLVGGKGASLGEMYRQLVPKGVRIPNGFATTAKAFREAGNPFDPRLAESLRRHIYGSGNSLDPGAAYAAFRGRAPTVTPLLRKRGLIPDEAQPA